MPILTVSNLNKSYGTFDVFKNVSFSIEKGEKVGIVGPNGAGKSTLLSILSGELGYDDGKVFIPDEINIGYLHQQAKYYSDLSIHDEMLKIFQNLIDMEKELSEISKMIPKEEGEERNRLLNSYARLTEEYDKKGGYRFRSDIKGVLSSLAFPTDWLDRPVNSLSGGEKTRLFLAGLLLRKPDLLLLDEPTNHLDIGTLAWLEQYINSYRGAVLICSHDRYFLDQTVSRIFHIEDKRLLIYAGNYTQYRENMEAERETEKKHYEEEIREIKRQEEMIRTFKQHKTEKLAKRAKSRERRLSNMTLPERPTYKDRSLKFSFKEKYKSGSTVLEAENLSKRFSTRTLFSDVSLDIKRKERVCLVGANGIGKTTLLKILIGDMTPDSGFLRHGQNVVIAYYDQEQANLSLNLTVFEEIQNLEGLYNDTEIRSMLAIFKFTDDDVFKKIIDLSGGEKARVSLLKMMLSGANFLVMDEPTNHLDSDALEAFEKALLNFEGTILAVSHDRYFLNRIPTKIVELTENGLLSYLGDYDYYMEKRKSTSEPGYLKDLGNQISTFEDPFSDEKEEEKKRKLEERRRKKAEAAEERRTEREILSLEGKIAALETELKELEKEIAKDELANDYEALMECTEKMSAIKKELELTYEEWVLKH